MGAIDAAIVAVFVLYALGSGLRHRRAASRGLEDYFLAGRTLSGWQAGASMAATQFAADTPLVVAGIVATRGVFPLWQLWSYGLAFLLLGFLFAPCWRRAQVLTDAELSELRYGGRAAAWLRAVRAVLYGTLFNCVVLAMVLFASTLFAEQFLHWHAWLPPALFAPVRSLVEVVGVPLTRSVASSTDVWTVSADNLISIALVTAVTLAYSTSGGLRSVVATDVVQLAIMLVATACFTVLAVRAAGPDLTSALHARFDAARSDVPTASQLLALGPTGARDASWGLAAVFALQWLLQRNADGTGYLAQRVMACRSDVEACRAAVVFSYLQIVLRSLLWVPLALALLLLVPSEPGLQGADLVLDRERSFVRAMPALLPAGLLGLMLTGMFAALASTVDTHLNWGASYWANDLFRGVVAERWLGREPSQRSLVRVARLANAALLALSLLIMTQLDSVQSAWKASLVLGAGMGPPMILRWLWWRMNAWGELASLAISALLAPVAILGLEGEALRMAVVAIVSVGGCVAVSLATAPEDAERLQRFFERVRPPGWWGPVANAAGRDRHEPLRALGDALLRTAAAAVSLFACLVGLLWPLLGGSVLVAGAMLIAAVLAVPFWSPPLRRNARRG
jgi:solute:Na+ symporter, SSS family